MSALQWTVRFSTYVPTAHTDAFWASNKISSLQQLLHLLMQDLLCYPAALSDVTSSIEDKGTAQLSPQEKVQRLLQAADFDDSQESQERHVPKSRQGGCKVCADQTATAKVAATQG